MINRLLMVMGMVSVTSCGPVEGQSGDTADTGLQYSGYEPLDGTEAARLSCVYTVEIHDFDRDLVGREYCVAPNSNLPFYWGFGGDCDDGNPLIKPGASDLTVDGTDQDCTGVDGVPTGALYYLDLDRDGYGSAWSGTNMVLTTGFVANNTDCDDTSTAIYPGAVESCDGVESNCDGNWDTNYGSQMWYRDSDLDTYGSTTVFVNATRCVQPAGFIDTGGDCKDDDFAVKPSATEVCDSKDNDCDGVVDETCSNNNTTWYRNVDGDNYGQTSQPITASVQPAGYTALPGDCNDGDAGVYPGATEVVNGKDDDCDTLIDEGGNNVTCYYDADNDLFRTNVVIAVNNDTDCDDAGEANPNEPSGDCNDNDPTVSPGDPEVTNGKDDDCDGQTDENSNNTTYYLDADGDGAGNPGITSTVALAGYVFGNGTDCDDSNANRTPGRTETCDGMDNDCDYIIDEGVTGATWYRDADGDNYGSNTVTQQACAMPTGYIATSGDCQDGNAAIRPNAPELCNSQDDDCDGIVDDNATGTTTWYLDTDHDTYGVSNVSTQACIAPANYANRSGDCNDGSAVVSPQANEVCDSMDNDCDGLTDENGSTTWYLDSDHDGYGLSNVSTQSCLMPANYASLSGDCDDNNGNRAPNRTEVCDGMDNDCDYQVDETCSTGTYWRDQDGDGYGNVSGGTSSYAQTGFASSANGTDCDDNNGNRSPGRTEVCSDNTDNDCDYQVDENCSNNNGTTWYLDVDGDGYGQTNLTTTATSRPAGYAALSGDCNDANQNISPGDPEVASNNVDDDCDGSIDENGSNTTGLTREVCVIDAGTSYRLGFADVTPWDTSRFVSDSGSTAVVNNPILTYSGGATSSDQCTTVTLSNAGTTLVFNGWGSNTGMWHDYLVGTCTGSSGATIERNSTLGKCATLRISVDSVINGVSDGSPEWAQLRSSDNNLSWTD